MGSNIIPCQLKHIHRPMMASDRVSAVMRIDNGQLIMDNAGKMIVYVEVVMSAFPQTPYKEDSGGYCGTDAKIRLILLFAKLNC